MSVVREGPTPLLVPRWQRWLWRAWTPLVWIVPLLLLALRYVMPGVGWETIALILYGPIWYPLLAGAAWAPRIIWRARAGKLRQPPRALAACILLHWGGLLLAVLTGRGVGDLELFDSMLGRLLPFLGPVAQDVTLYAALALAAVGLLGAWAIVVSARPIPAPAVAA